MDKSSLGDKFDNEILYNRCYCKLITMLPISARPLAFLDGPQRIQKRNEIVKDQDGQFNIFVSKCGQINFKAKMGMMTRKKNEVIYK